jgi:hypothetical protein
MAREKDCSKGGGGGHEEIEEEMAAEERVIGFPIWSPF